MMRLVAAVLVAALAAAGCSSPPADPPGAQEVPTTPAGSTNPSPPPSPAQSPAPQPAVIPIDDGAAVPPRGVVRVSAAGAALSPEPGGPPTSRLRAGVVVPFAAVKQGWIQVTTPCANSGWLSIEEVERLVSPQVVLDPGHGGEEEGAVGPSGLKEKDVNLQVASRAAQILNREGIATALTREQDYRAALAFRAAVAAEADPAVFVSIHHNADPDGPMDGPGTETYYQLRSAASKRLAGLVYEEVVAELSAFPAAWVGDTDAGAKWRLNSRGSDYYGVLRMTFEAQVPSILAELSFVSNESEEQLLRGPEPIEAEARGVASGVMRYLGSQDPGSGFTTPYPRRQPAGPGGGVGGCIDPS